MQTLKIGLSMNTCPTTAWKIILEVCKNLNLQFTFEEKDIKNYKITSTQI